MRQKFKKILDKLIDLLVYIFVRPVEFSEQDYIRIVKEKENAKEKIEEHYKKRIYITDDMILETFDNDDDCFRDIRYHDIFLCRTKEDIINRISGNCTNPIYIKFHLRVHSKMDEIIKHIDNIESFEWIRIYFLGMDNFVKINKKNNPKLSKIRL